MSTVLPISGRSTSRFGALRPLPFLPPAISVLALFLLFFFQLGARDLVSSHEARAAQNSQRMIDTGEWGLPTLFDGQRDLQKPPGFYWLGAVAGCLTGGHVSPWAARFPAAASGTLVVLLVYGFLRREGWRSGAFVAAVALATANHFVAIGRTARIDVPLTCAVTVALLAFSRGSTAGLASRGSRREGWFLLSALAAGVAVLLKGPVGLALIGSTAVAFLIAERFATTPAERARLSVLSAILGVAVVACVALPWFVWAQHATEGEFVRVFFWHHNVERFAGTSEALASHPWWYYGPRFAMAFLPWTLLLVPLVWWGTRSGVWKEERLFRLGVVWLVVMVAVLSASRFKRADYLLPAFPGAAIALGCAAERWLTSRGDARSAVRAKWGFGALVAGALAVCPVMWFVVEPVENARQEKRPFAAAIREYAPKPQTILLFRAESHLLAFHLGAPLHTLVEWGELKEVLAAPGPHAVVMPPEYVDEAERITGRKLVPVASLADFTSIRPPRPLVCLRTAE
ncbi:glycosyltransferase family 39 protein [Gemmata sp. G18]|uniref:Glycosyltransferase family 39 protein n=1 Tax=Gemmata palustris TaxID=2822762 RepID=A0ABS5C384_9BACT|nr:glycosyltransferase family 39 protein [Gemmata palustris]MBP3960444.1 glycosyltransferase family 39 protein [Gemmata palustris]